MEKLLYPFQYFRLQNSEVRFINFVPTVIFAAIIFLPFAVIPKANFFGAGGFLVNLAVLTAALTGFYVAALTAAATFAHADLDKVMTYGAVKRLVTLEDKTTELQSLTRREFVCLVFGFLAFSAMSFTILASMAIAIAPAVNPVIMVRDHNIAPYVSLASQLLFIVWISHLFVVTCLGLYYLMDRLHRRDKSVVTRADGKKAA
ncbi:hypothetical protein [Mesorhizobium sp.]|uniref:hypothetical protein n=1 Tax=Mesorhizobium sp. TaxID=1871066 RepID=UPI000FEA387B|nr:hypothetical protein [Mesorhizobium sp.]RWQ14502.1 MAG: hypothetical protein EOR93_29105 [Mesorhizobium sp.]